MSRTSGTGLSKSCGVANLNVSNFGSCAVAYKPLVEESVPIFSRPDPFLHYSPIPAILSLSTAHHWSSKTDTVPPILSSSRARTTKTAWSGANRGVGSTSWTGTYTASAEQRSKVAAVSTAIFPRSQPDKFGKKRLLRNRPTDESAFLCVTRPCIKMSRKTSTLADVLDIYRSDAAVCSFLCWLRFRVRGVTRV